MNNNNNNNNNKNEILFWNIFKNQFLFKKIFNEISNQEIEFDSLDKYYLGHRTKFKFICNLNFMVLRGLWEILRIKLVANETIEINNPSIEQFITIYQNKENSLMILLYKRIVSLDISNYDFLIETSIKHSNLNSLLYLINDLKNEIKYQYILLSIKFKLYNIFKLLMDTLKQRDLEKYKILYNGKDQLTIMAIASKNSKIIKHLYVENLFVPVDFMELSKKHQYTKYTEYPVSKFGFKSFNEIQSLKAKTILLNNGSVLNLSKRDIDGIRYFSFTFEKLKISIKLINYYLVLFFKLFNINQTNKLENYEKALNEINQINQNIYIEEKEKEKLLLEILINGILDNNIYNIGVGLELNQIINRSIFYYYIDSFGFNCFYENNEKFKIKTIPYLFETWNFTQLDSLFSRLEIKINSNIEKEINSIKRFNENFQMDEVLDYLKLFKLLNNYQPFILPKKFIKSFISNSSIEILNESLSSNLLKPLDFFENGSFYFFNSSFNHFKWYINEIIIANGFESIQEKKQEILTINSKELIDFLFETINKNKSLLFLLNSYKIKFDKLKFIKYHCDKFNQDPSIFFYRYLTNLIENNIKTEQEYRFNLMLSKEQAKENRQEISNKNEIINGMKTIKKEKLIYWLTYLSRYNYESLESDTFRSYIILLFYSIIKKFKYLDINSTVCEYKEFKIPFNLFPSITNQLLKSSTDLCMVKLILENNFILKDSETYLDYQIELDDNPDEIFINNYKLIEYLLIKLSSQNKIQLFIQQFNRLYLLSLSSIDISFDKILKLEKLFQTFSIPIYKDCYHIFFYLSIKSTKLRLYFNSKKDYLNLLQMIYRNNNLEPLNYHEIINQDNFPLDYIINSSIEEIILKLQNLSTEKYFNQDDNHNYEYSKKIIEDLEYLSNIHSFNLIERLIVEIVIPKEKYITLNSWIKSFTKSLLKYIDKDQIPNLYSFYLLKEIKQQENNYI